MTGMSQEEYSAQFSDWVRIGTKFGCVETTKLSDSAQFSDWVRIGTIEWNGESGLDLDSAQFSDWVRIGTPINGA